MPTHYSQQKNSGVGGPNYQGTKGYYDRQRAGAGMGGAQPQQQTQQPTAQQGAQPQQPRATGGGGAPGGFASGPYSQGQTTSAPPFRVATGGAAQPQSSVLQQNGMGSAKPTAPRSPIDELAGAATPSAGNRGPMYDLARGADAIPSPSAANIDRSTTQYSGNTSPESPPGLGYEWDPASGQWVKPGETADDAAVRMARKLYAANKYGNNFDDWWTSPELPANWAELAWNQADELSGTINDYTSGQKEIPDNVLDVREVDPNNPWESEIRDQYGKIDTDITNQEEHLKSQMRAEKARAMNELAGALGARGMGSSPMAFAPGALDIESAYSGQMADALSELQDKKIAQQQALLGTIGTLGTTEEKMDLDAQMANQQQVDINAPQIEQQMDFADAEFIGSLTNQITTNAKNIETLLEGDVNEVYDGTVFVELMQRYDDALAEYKKTLNPAELEAIAAEINALYQEWLSKVTG